MAETVARRIVFARVRCGYDFHGPPTDGHLPECGLDVPGQGLAGLSMSPEDSVPRAAETVMPHTVIIPMAYVAGAAETESAAGAGVAACLKCGYDLRGLADDGRCPECG